MAHELLRLLCLEFKVVDYPYFMTRLELWEAYLLCENLQYCDRSIWESSRIIAFMVAQSNSKKKLKLSDVSKFEWENTKKSKPEHLSREEINKRSENFLKRINGKRT